MAWTNEKRAEVLRRLALGIRPLRPKGTTFGVTASVRRMSRKELEAAHIAAGIARWGESERHGLRRQAVRKTLEMLRREEGLRLAYAAQLSRDDERVILRLLTSAKRLRYESRRALGTGIL